MQQELGGWEAFLGMEETEENYGIFVLIDLTSKSFDDQLGLLTFAFELKEELGQPVSVIVAGNSQNDHIERLKKFPVSEIHVKKISNQRELIDFLKSFIEEKKPLVLVGDLDTGARDAFPYIAQTRNEGYIGGGESLSISPDDRKVIVKRKIYGGLLVETVKILKDGVQFVTLKSSEREAPQESEPQDVEVKEW